MLHVGRVVWAHGMARRSFALLMATVAYACRPTPRDAPNTPDSYPPEVEERRILGRLNALSGTSVNCDVVLNASGSITSMRASVHGRTTVLLFWRPSCSYCEPVLRDLETLADDRVRGLAVVSAVESREPGAIAAMIRSVGGVSFPVCEYSDHGQSKRWQAEGVPLVVVFDSRGHAARASVGRADSASLVAQLRAGWRP